MDMITAIADRHGLAVIEDGGGAHGAMFRGSRAGSWGHGAFGLYGAGQGGLITTNDDRLADWTRRYRDHGRRGRQAEAPGFDFHLSEVAAAIGWSAWAGSRPASSRAARSPLATVGPLPNCPSAGRSPRPADGTSSTATRSGSGQPATRSSPT